MDILEQQLLTFIQEVYITIGWPGVVILMALESIVFPIPSEVILPLAGWMLISAKGLSVWYVLPAALYGAIGSLAGALFIYAIGYYGGRPLLERSGRYILISKDDLATADQWFERHGTWAVILARIVPVARSLISIPAGVTRMHLATFSLLTLAGSFVWSLTLITAGFFLGENWGVLRNIIRPIEIPVLFLAAILVALFVYKRIRKIRTKKEEDADSKKGHPVP
jgi:membrane protein DedA with SNARE-associated domain